MNEAPRIGGTITAAGCTDAQIIVADGGSTDRTASSPGPTARVSSTPNGAGQANKTASAAVAHGHVLLFLHADTRLPTDYIAAHVFDTLMDRSTVLGAFRFATDIRTPAMRWIAFWTNLRSKWLQLPYGDQGLFLRRTDFLEIKVAFPTSPLPKIFTWFDVYVEWPHRPGTGPRPSHRAGAGKVWGHCEPPSSIPSSPPAVWPVYRRHGWHHFIDCRPGRP